MEWSLLEGDETVMYRKPTQKNWHTANPAILVIAWQGKWRITPLANTLYYYDFGNWKWCTLFFSPENCLSAMFCLLYRRVLPILGHPMGNRFRTCRKLPNDNSSDLRGKEKEQQQQQQQQQQPMSPLWRRPFTLWALFGEPPLGTTSRPRTAAIGFHNGPLVNGAFALHIIHLIWTNPSEKY